jgi:hypothetical protein
MGVDAELIRALGAGRLRRAAGWSAGADGGPAVEALIDAEVATRRGEAGLAELVDLAARIEAEGGDDPVVRWWAGALVAERCGLDLDVPGAARAAAVLAEVPDDTLAPVLVLWVRGRLRRADALVRLFGRSPDRGGSQRLRSLAIADFARGGLPEEVAVTRVLGAATEALWLMEDVEQNVAVAVDARAMVGADSAWAPLLDAVLAVLAVGAGDRPMAERSLATGRRSRSASTLGAAVPVLQAMCAADSQGDSPVAVAALAEAAVGLSAADPLGGHHIRLVAASGLLDVAQDTVARELALPVMDMPAVDEVDEVERDLFKLRLRLCAGEDVPMGTLTAALERFAAVGHHRRQVDAARRLANDLGRLGRGADAARLGTRGAVPPVVALPDDRLGGSLSAVTGVRVRVMAPAVAVDLDGRRCPLRTTGARLLLALVLAHPAPLPAEAAAGALWPEGLWGTDRRQRLNTVVHRLRQSLGHAGAAVGRVGDMLSLDAHGWDVDLFRLRRALWPGPTTGDAGSTLAETLAEVSGNLGHVEFPYDEQLVDERHALLAAVLRGLDGDAAFAGAHHACIDALRALGAPPS